MEIDLANRISEDFRGRALGGYIVDDYHSHGGTSVILCGHDQKKLVAIKVYDKGLFEGKDGEQAKAELERINRQLSMRNHGHPNIVQTLCAGMVSPSDSLAVPFHEKNPAVSRRWLIMAGGMLATTVVLFLMAYLGMNHTDRYSQQTVLDEAILYFDADLPATQGQLLMKTSPPNEFSFSKALRPLRGIRWRAVKNFMGQSGVAFDLPTQGGARATLYAINLSTKGIADSPDLKPSFTTGGCCTTAWQENGLLYVLVVRGNRQSYQQYLKLPTGPVA